MQPGSHFLSSTLKPLPFNLRYSNVIHIKGTGAGVTNEKNITFRSSWLNFFVFFYLFIYLLHNCKGEFYVRAKALINAFLKEQNKKITIILPPNVAPLTKARNHF